MPFSFWAKDTEADETEGLLTSSPLFSIGRADNAGFAKELADHIVAKEFASDADAQAVANAIIAVLPKKSGDQVYSADIDAVIAPYDSYADLAQAVEGKQLQPPEAHVVEPTVAQQDGPGPLSLFGQEPAALLRPQPAPTVNYIDDADERISEILVTEPLPQPAASAKPNQRLTNLPDTMREAAPAHFLIKELTSNTGLNEEAQEQLGSLAKTNPGDLLDVLGKAYFPDGRADVARQKASRMIDALNGHGREGVTPSAITVDAWFKNQSQTNPFEPAVAKIIANSPADMKRWAADFNHSAEQATQASRHKLLAAKLAAKRVVVEPVRPDPDEEVDVSARTPTPAAASGAARGDSQSPQGQGSHKAALLNQLHATFKARSEGKSVKQAVAAGKAAVITTPTAPPMPPAAAPKQPAPKVVQPVSEPAASAPSPAPAVHDAPKVVPPRRIPVSFWAKDDSGEGLTLQQATSAIASGFSGADADRAQLKSYVEIQTAAFLQGHPNALSVQSRLLDKLGFPPAGQQWRPTQEHIQFATTLASIRIPRQLEAAVDGCFDAQLQQRCDAVVLGKYNQRKHGWQYVRDRIEFHSLADEAMRSHGNGDVYAITVNPNDPLSPMRKHENVAWVNATIGETEIDVPGTDCKSIQGYMTHAKDKLGEGAWTPANQEAVFAHAMVCVAADRGQKLGTDYADVCQHYVDTAGDKPWVMTPEVRQALGLHEQFSLDAAKRDAFEQMHTHPSCRFAKTLDDVDYGGEAAGLKEGGSGLPVEKLKRYPQFQERMWQQFWREFGQGKVSYLEDKEGRPVVKCGADGAAVVYVGQRDFMSVTAQGGQKSNGIKSDAEAEALVQGILRQREIQGTGNRKPLVAYGKRTQDILRIVKACLKCELPVRLGSDAVSQRALKKLSHEERQEVEGHMAYRDVKSQASSGTGGNPSATSMQKAIAGPNAGPVGQPEPPPPVV